MHCKNCGGTVLDSARYCIFCGARLDGDSVELETPCTEYRFLSAPPPRQTELFAVTGFVIGLLSVLGSLAYCIAGFSDIAAAFWLPALAGAAVSSIGMHRAVKYDRRGHALGVVGLILSVLLLAFIAVLSVGYLLSSSLPYIGNKYYL